MPRLTDEEFMAKDVDWSKARRVTPEEHARYKEAVANTRRTRGRPKKPPAEKYQPVTIRLDPRVIAWAKKEAKKQHVGYQTVLNQFLLQSIVK